MAQGEGTGFDLGQVCVVFVVNKVVLGQFYLLVLLFPLPVSFHQCSILICLSVTDTVYLSS